MTLNQSLIAFEPAKPQSITMCRNVSQLDGSESGVDQDQLLTVWARLSTGVIIPLVIILHRCRPASKIV